MKFHTRLMNSVEIVAHRGASNEDPENTLAAFNRAIELGADAIECDVRLTSDQVPIVYHYYYLECLTAVNGPVFNYTAQQIEKFKVFGQNGKPSNEKIPTLFEVLEEVDGKIGLEIELKGPEVESARIVAGALNQFTHSFDAIEVTSYEPLLLIEFKAFCPEIATDLLIPRSESWMGLDIVTHNAVYRAKQAQARAVHLHPTQLTAEVVEAIHHQGIEIHAWDVNSEKDLDRACEFEIARICTDDLTSALQFFGRITYEHKKQSTEIKSIK